MEEINLKIIDFIIKFNKKITFLYKFRNQYYYVGYNIFEECKDEKLIKKYEEYIELYEKNKEFIESNELVCFKGKYMDITRRILPLVEIYDSILIELRKKDYEFYEKYKNIADEEKTMKIKGDIYSNIKKVTNSIAIDEIIKNYDEQSKRNFGNIYFINDRNNLEKYLQK